MKVLRYTYDNMERLLTTTVERDGAEPVLLCSNTYDDLGRMATHSLGGTAEGNHAESLTIKSQTNIINIIKIILLTI